MKYLQLFLMLFSIHSAISQIEYTDIIKPRLSFVSDISEASDITNWVIIEKDTFYSKYKSDYDLSFLDDSNYQDAGTVSRYQLIIFLFEDENSKLRREIKQWAAPIVVYLDKKLPKVVRKQFQEFYSQITGIENLHISFTSKLENANYFIQVTSETVNGYKDDYKFYNDEERENSILTGGKYALKTDKNNKMFSGIMKINPQGKNNSSLLKQLKQLFFLSLGQFAMGTNSDSRSLISGDYDNGNEVIDYDLNLLKIHYSIIYDRKINRTIFKKLIDLSKQEQ